MRTNGRWWKMNIDNRRLRQIRLEKRVYLDQMNKARTPSEKQVYQGKISCLDKEERNILKRYGVEV